MNNPYTHAALAEDRHRTLMAEAETHRRRRDARRSGSPGRALPRRWIARMGAAVKSQLAKGAMRPVARDVMTEATREPSLAAWIDSLSGHPGLTKTEAKPWRYASDVLIRPIDVRDRGPLAEGFARLSIRSRQLRFLGAKASLSPAELDYLTNVDHSDREALVALDAQDGRGIGVARYTRDPNDPQAAEVAITVIDEWQRRGLGTELMIRLIERARDEDILRFTALISNDNVACVNLLKGLHLEIAVIERDYQTTEYEIALPR